MLALVRGDDRLSESKLLSALQAARPAGDRRRDPRRVRGVAAARSARSASRVEVVADEALREGQFVAGANRDGFHLRGVEAGRDYEPRFADLREPREGDRCPECGGALRFQTAIEVGHIFNFGDRYSEGLERDVPRRGRPREAAPRRKLRNRAGAHNRGGDRAEPRRARNRSLAEVDRARTTSTSSCCPASRSRPDAVAATLGGAGCSVLLDDRDLRAGEKFADADLIGCPVRVTVGKKTLEDGKVDVRDRATGEERRLDAQEVSC